MSNMPQHEPLMPYAQVRIRDLANIGRRIRQLLMMLRRPRLEKARKTLLAIHKRLATTRQPRIGEKQAQRLAQYLNRPADFLLVEAKEVTQTRIEAALAWVEAELAGLYSSPTP
jgi:hypothetical protein